MGRPCTYGSLDGEQGWLEGLVVQTLRVKMRRSCVSQTRTMGELDMHSTHTVGEPDTHRGRARHAPRTS